MVLKRDKHEPASPVKKEEEKSHHSHRKQYTLSVSCSYPSICQESPVVQNVLLALWVPSNNTNDLQEPSQGHSMKKCIFYIHILVLPNPVFCSPNFWNQGRCCQEYLYIPRSWLCAFSCPSKYSRLYPLQSLFMPTGHMGSWSDWLCFTSRYPMLTLRPGMPAGPGLPGRPGWPDTRAQRKGSKSGSAPTNELLLADIPA